MKKINKTVIKEMSELMDELHLSDLEYSDNGISIKISKKQSLQNFSENKTQSTTKIKKDNFEKDAELSNKSLKAPIVGTVYLAPEPGAKPFIELGQSVKRGQVLLIIEAMKTMNEITSQKNGIIKKIFVRDATPVEFGEPLVLIE